MVHFSRHIAYIFLLLKNQSNFKTNRFFQIMEYFCLYEHIRKLSWNNIAHPPKDGIMIVL